MKKTTGTCYMVRENNKIVFVLHADLSRLADKLLFLGTFGSPPFPLPRPGVGPTQSVREMMDRIRQADADNASDAQSETQRSRRQRTGFPLEHTVYTKNVFFMFFPKTKTYV